MQESAHISSSVDNRLENRVNYYRKVLGAHERVKTSLGLLHERHWADSLGEKEEVQKAAKITANSLHKALQELSETDIREAEERGMLDENQVRKFVQLKREQKMRDIRDRKNSVSHTQSRKQR